MHQAVLVDADVDEGAERGHVGDHALQHHAGDQVLDLVDALGERRGLEGRARVAAGLLQLGEDVGHRRQAERLVDEVRRLHSAQRAGVADQAADVGAGGGQDAPDHRVGLGVDAGGVQRVVAAGDAQEARTLLERLRPEPGDLTQRRAGPERPGGVPVGDDVVGEGRADTGHPGQQRRGRRVHVDTDGVHAVLDDGVERAGQLQLAQVVLVLADADRLRVDLDQLGERVLQAAGDRHGAAQRHVQLRQLPGGVRTRRVDRRAGLRNDDLGELQLRHAPDELLRELVGLPRRGAVADRDQVDLVRRAQPGEGHQRLVPAPRRDVRVDRVGGDDLAGGVDDGDLHAGAVARVETHGRPGAGGRGEQQVAQVGGEHLDGLVLGGLEEPQPQVDSQVDQDPGAPRPADRVREPAVGGPALGGDAEAGRDPGLVLGRDGGRRHVGVLRLRVEIQVEDLLLLAAEQGQDPV